MMNFFYCPTEDCSCPYYNCRSGLCALGKKALEECDDAYAAVGEEYEEEEEYTPQEIFAVYDPDPPID